MASCPVVDDAVFPRLSTDVLLGATADGGAAYDKVTETLHHLSGAGAAVLESCDGTTRIDTPVTAWADAAGVDVADLRAIVQTHLTGLAELGLVDRTTRADGHPERVGSLGTVHGTHTGVTHAVLDHGIAVRCDDTALLERIDTYLGTGDPTRHPDIHFDVTAGEGGRVVLRTDDEWDFPSADQLIRQICGVVNEYASRTRTMAALHAAGLCTPSGNVVLLSGPPGAGKSTLAAGCIAVGWDHLGDESIGVRPGTLDAVGYPKPLTLSSTSRGALGLDPDVVWPEVPVEALRPDAERCAGDVGPISHIVFVTYTPGADVEISTVTGTDALDAICAATLNLGGIGAADFQALCDLAERATVVQLVHGDVIDAVPALVGLVAS